MLLKIQFYIIVVLLGGCSSSKQLSTIKSPIKEEMIFLSESETRLNFRATCEDAVELAESFELINNDSIYFTLNKPTSKAIGIFVEGDGFSAPLKVGIHKTLFKDGNVKSEGEYKIGSYTQCCTAGYCCEYYNYKSGLWKYYFNTSEIKATVKYDTKVYEMRTSCGSDTMIFHNVKSIQTWDSTGNKTKLITAEMMDEYLEEFIGEEYSITKYKPVNDSIMIDLVFKNGVEH